MRPRADAGRQPRSTPPSPQLDVAGTLSEGCLDDSAIPPPSGVRRQTCGAPIFRAATILDRGQRLGYTAAARRRAARRRRAATPSGGAPSAARRPRSPRARRPRPPAGRPTRAGARRPARTSTSGADAPAVTPTALLALEPLALQVLRAVDEIARDAGLLGDLAQAIGIRAASASRRRAARRSARRAASPRPGGSASRSRCLPCAALASVGNRARSASTIAAVSSTDSVVCVTNAEPRRIAHLELRDVARRSRRGGCARRARCRTGPSCLRLPDGPRGRSGSRRGLRARSARLPCAPWSPADRWRRTP